MSWRGLSSTANFLCLLGIMLIRYHLISFLLVRLTFFKLSLWHFFKTQKPTGNERKAERCHEKKSQTKSGYVVGYIIIWIRMSLWKKIVSKLSSFLFIHRVTLTRIEFFHIASSNFNKSFLFVWFFWAGSIATDRAEDHSCCNKQSKEDTWIKIMNSGRTTTEFHSSTLNFEANNFSADTKIASNENIKNKFPSPSS